MSGICPECGHPWDEHQMNSPIRTERYGEIVVLSGQHGREGCTHRTWTANNVPRQCGCGKIEPPSLDWLGSHPEGGTEP